MATEIISTNLTATYLLDRNDNLFVTQKGSAIVSGANAVQTRTNLDSHLDLILLGHVEATGLAAPGVGASAVFLQAHVIGGQVGATHNSVTVGSTGSLLALQGFGIFNQGSAATITNLGSIEAWVGIHVYGGDNRVENAGVITATEVGIEVGGVGNDLNPGPSHIHNSGTILTVVDPLDPTALGWGISIFANWVQVTNDGTIDARLGILSQGSHMAVSNSGTIDASTGPAIVFGYSFGSLVNTGTITNHGRQAAIDAVGLQFPSTNGLNILNSGRIESDAIAVSGALRSVINDGDIVGGGDGIHVDFSDRFRLVNGGLIEASDFGVFHDVGLRCDILNLGTISGLGNPANPGFAIFTSQVGGYVDNKGILLGEVHIEAGRLINDGTITGDVTVAFGKVLNSGVIDGDLFLFDSNTYVGSGTGVVTGSINGSNGFDRLLGADLADRILGNDEADTIFGGGGDDVLTGGMGQDRLTGGTGADMFIYGAAAESVVGVGVDRITDFVAGVDRIDLSAFLAGASFVGAAGFSGAGPEVRYDAATGVLRSDVDGDRVVDFVVVLTNHAAITAGDLIF